MGRVMRGPLVSLRQGNHRAAMACGLAMAGFIAAGLLRALRCQGRATCGSRLAAITDFSQRRSFFMVRAPLVVCVSFDLDPKVTGLWGDGWAPNVKDCDLCRSVVGQLWQRVIRQFCLKLAGFVDNLSGPAGLFPKPATISAAILPEVRAGSPKSGGHNPLRPRGWCGDRKKSGPDRDRCNAASIRLGRPRRCATGAGHIPAGRTASGHPCR